MFFIVNHLQRMVQPLALTIPLCMLVSTHTISNIRLYFTQT